MTEKVNASELARRLGVSEAAVRKHVRRGLYSPDRDGSYDVEMCRAAWQAQRDPDAVAKGQAGGAAVSGAPAAPFPEGALTKARAAREGIRATREKIALDRTRGLLIPTEDAYRACRAVITIVVERIDGAAAQLGPRVVGLDAAGAERVAREVLSGIRAEIAKMAGAIEEVANGQN